MVKKARYLIIPSKSENKRTISSLVIQLRYCSNKLLVGVSMITSSICFTWLSSLKHYNVLSFSLKRNNKGINQRLKVVYENGQLSIVLLLEKNSKWLYYYLFVSSTTQSSYHPSEKILTSNCHWQFVPNGIVGDIDIA